MAMKTRGEEGRAGRVLIAGCGYVGCRLAEMLVARGDRVWGMRRGPAELPGGVRPLVGDVTDPATLEGLPEGLDAVVHAVSPGGRSRDAYHAVYVDGLTNLLDAVERQRGEGVRALLVGSTGVYGQTDGRWVDETTDPEPADPTGEVLLEAEALVGRRGRPGIVLRLGGIYGPGRTRVVRRVTSGDAGCPDPGKHGNRIHVEDAAGAAAHLLALDDPHPLYLGVDRDPAPLREVYRWIAARAGAADPCAGAESEEWEARGRRGTSKRCSSDRLTASGYRFRYPTFREGYAALMEGAGPAD